MAQPSVDETVTIELREPLARELADALEHEIEQADEYHSTEQIFEEATSVIRRHL